MPRTNKVQLPPVARALADAFDSNTRLVVLNPRFHFVSIDVTIYAKILDKFLIEDIAENKPNQKTKVRRSSIEYLTRELKKFVLTNYGSRPIIKVEDPKTWDGIFTPANQNDFTVTSKAEAAKPRKDAKLPAIVQSKGKIVGVLFSSFNSSYDGLFRAFLNDTMKKYLRTDIERGNYAIGFDVGHMPGTSEYTLSPLQYKLDTLATELSKQMANVTDPEKQDVLSNIQTQIELEKNRLLENTKGTEISGHIEKNFGTLGEFLVSIKAILVVPQDSYDNKGIQARLLEDKIDKIVSAMIKVNFSRNLIQEIGYRVAASIKGLKVSNTKATKKLPTIKLEPTVRIGNAQLTSNKGSSASSAGSSIKRSNVAVNLTSLQSLINTHLQDVISANMGSGDSSSILNYRTGRFASSAKVERMSQSREGMITAFYSYMQNPYATFSDGGRQGTPKSRDPKLLIAKSIREIAAIKVANRMRAVLA